MGAKIGGIILLVIALGVALYFVQSGGAAKLGTAIQPPNSTSSTLAASSSTASGVASSTASSTNPFITFLNELFHPTPFTAPTISAGGGSGENGGSGGAVYTQTGGSGSNGESGTSAIPPDEIPTGYTLAQLSPYFHDVRLGEVGTQQLSLYSYETYNQPTTTIDITGWEIKTNRGGEYVPQAVNLYDPDTAPVLSDIILSTDQNSYVYFYASSAPVDLRLNECMGFLTAASQSNQTNQFNPPLPYSCPSVSTTQLTSFTGACQNYILSLGCQAPDLSSSQIPRNDYACRQYLENNFTYSSCIMNHAHDADFFSNEWHVWMGQNGSPVDPYHDNVVLLDKNGLVVDTYNY